MMGQIDGNRKCKYEEICNVVVIVQFVCLLLFFCFCFNVQCLGFWGCCLFLFCH